LEILNDPQDMPSQPMIQAASERESLIEACWLVLL
jgi:hypothetical protein